MSDACAAAAAGHRSDHAGNPSGGTERPGRSSASKERSRFVAGSEYSGGTGSEAEEPAMATAEEPSAPAEEPSAPTSFAVSSPAPFVSETFAAAATTRHSAASCAGMEPASRSKNAAASASAARAPVEKSPPSPFPSASWFPFPFPFSTRASSSENAAAARVPQKKETEPLQRGGAKRGARGVPTAAAAAFFAESIAFAASVRPSLMAFAAAAAAVAPADVPGRNAAHIARTSSSARRSGSVRGVVGCPAARHNNGSAGFPEGTPNAASIASDAWRHTSHARDGVRDSSTSSGARASPARAAAAASAAEENASRVNAYVVASDCVAAASGGAPFASYRVARAGVDAASASRRRRQSCAADAAAPLLTRVSVHFSRAGFRGWGFRMGFRPIRLRPIRRLIDDGERAEERVFHRLRGGEEVRERVDVRVYLHAASALVGVGATPLGELRGGGAVGGDGGGERRRRERDGATRRKRRRARDARANRKSLRGRKSHGGVRGERVGGVRHGAKFERRGKRVREGIQGIQGIQGAGGGDGGGDAIDVVTDSFSVVTDSFSVVTDIFSVVTRYSPSSPIFSLRHRRASRRIHAATSSSWLGASPRARRARRP